MATVTARGTGSRSHLEPPPASLVPPAGVGAVRRRAAAPGGAVVLGAVLAGVGLWVPGLLLVLAAVGVVVASRVLGDPARLLATLPTRPADPVREAGLLNLTEGLCRANGLATPRVAVLEDAAANAITLGTSEADATLICTSGLLALLDRMELEAVVAHELAHLKRGEVALAARVSRSLGLSARVSPGAEVRARRLCGPGREIGADLDGVRITRYPPALHGALHKVSEAPTAPAGLARATRRLTGPLWLVPLSDGRPPVLVGELDVAARLSALAEL